MFEIPEALTPQPSELPDDGVWQVSCCFCRRPVCPERRPETGGAEVWLFTPSAVWENLSN